MKTIQRTAMFAAIFMLLVCKTFAQSDNAIYISQSIPGEMDAGKQYNISVTMKNTGNTTWKQGSYSLKMISGTDNPIVGWGLDKVDLSSIASPGEQVSFNFTVTAPNTDGSYNLQWQMATGNAYFGEPTILAPVRVSISSSSLNTTKKGIRNNATFSYQQVPTDMDGGHTYAFSMTVNNNGSTTWTQSDYKIKVISGWAEKGNTWAIPDLELPYDISPGTTAMINFNVTAPDQVGTYNFQTQLTKDGVAFGDPSTVVPIDIH